MRDRIKWVVRDDIWTEEEQPDGTITRVHSLGEPYQIEMSDSDLSFYNLSTYIGVGGMIAIVAAVFGIAIS